MAMYIRVNCGRAVPPAESTPLSAEAVWSGMSHPPPATTAATIARESTLLVAGAVGFLTGAGLAGFIAGVGVD